jgi:biopolymer transport protein ExbB/TolQ
MHSVLAPTALAVWFVLGVIGTLATLWLVRRVWKRRAERPLAARGTAALVVAAAAYGALGTLAGLVKAFSAVGGESVDPSQKARILAEGIAQAMNCTAFGIIIWVPSAIAAFVLGRRRPAPPP